MKIDPEISRAQTPPAALYCDPEIHQRQRERVFFPSWQAVAPRAATIAARSLTPFTLFDVPLFLSRDDRGSLRALSNVCTHRGSILVDSACISGGIRCRYHGRRFDLNGKFLTMPEFEETENFPSPDDDLPRVSCAEWGPLAFASLKPAVPFEQLIAPLARRIDFLPLERAVLDPGSVREFVFDANWALYCDNYLEGFHIPFVHPSLSRGLEYSSYRTETYDYSSLQIGVAAEGEPCFSLPERHPDFGQNVAGYYFWLFPNTMLNIYPWGISLNIVEPRGVSRTAVHFASYVWDAAMSRAGAGGDLDRVEQEDEEVVLAVQRGIRSPLYKRGRYSPTREACVHHFHRLLTSAL